MHLFNGQTVYKVIGLKVKLVTVTQSISTLQSMTTSSLYAASDARKMQICNKLQ